MQCQLSLSHRFCCVLKQRVLSLSREQRLYCSSRSHHHHTLCYMAVSLSCQCSLLCCHARCHAALLKSALQLMQSPATAAAAHRAFRTPSPPVQHGNFGTMVQWYMYNAYSRLAGKKQLLKLQCVIFF